MDAQLPALPRSQAGPNPQHLLITLLGDFWSGNPVPVPSAALVRMLGEFGISPASARSAVLRLTSRGVLAASKAGRNTLYRLSDEVERVGHRNSPNLFEFADDRLEDWDGRWRLVCFTIPEERRQTRSSLRSTLRSHGFAAIQEGVWLSGHPFDPAFLRQLEEFDEPSITAFEADLVLPARLTGRLPAHPDTEGLATAYRSFIERYEPVLDALRRSSVSPVEAFVHRVRMADEWRGLYRRDPRMPHQLLPADWPLVPAGRLYVELYDGLGALAEMRARDLLRDFGLPEGSAPKVYRSADARARRP